MSSLEWIGYSVTRDRIQKMAEDGLFKAIGETDTLRGIVPESVVGRFRPSVGENRGSGDQGENTIPLPGIVISWLGHSRPPNAGNNDYDDGIITMLVQVVDRLDRSYDNNIESYMRWMVDIRETLQLNPYRDLCRNLGEIYLVHVTESVGPDQRAYILDEARLVNQVSLFTRARRDIGVKNYDT